MTEKQTEPAPTESLPEAQAEHDQEAVLAALRILPPRLRNQRVAELFLRTLHDAELRRDFRNRPLDYFKLAGILLGQSRLNKVLKIV